jgi:hypothetical protein
MGYLVWWFKKWSGINIGIIPSHEIKKAAHLSCLFGIQILFG